MKRILLTMATLTTVCMAMGQGMYYMPEFYFDKMSPNGKWLATQTEGIVYTYDREQDTYYEYLASEDAVTEFYGIGLGNCISNTGIIVGKYNDVDCAYLYNNEWYELPIDREENFGLNIANGITPDGKRIVGNVGISTMNLGSEQMVKPVYWDESAEGGYEMYKELPCPETDFTGRVPQYITAVSISDDGKTIVGQVVDWSGFFIYPIIYTQGEDGEWSYRTLCEGILYAEGTEFAEWPGEEPQKPDPTVYMNEEQKSAYLAALNIYLAEYEKMLNGEITWNDMPAEPDPADYITDNIEAYNTAMQEYNKALNDYYTALMEFDQILFGNTYDVSFTFNNIHLSGNGRYLNTTIESTDYTDPYRPKSTDIPTKIDLQTNTLTQIEGSTSMIASSVMNDGRYIVQNPAMAYGRNSYIVSADGKELTPFIDYLATINYDMWDFAKSMSVYDVIYIDGYDEYGNPNYSVANDSIVSGSVHCNSDGTIFTSFMYDEWSEGNIIRQFSYQVDFTQIAGVDATEKECNNFYVAGNTLYLKGEYTSVAVYNLNGACAMHLDAPSQATPLELPAGVYIVRAANNNRAVAKRVIIE